MPTPRKATQTSKIKTPIHAVIRPVMQLRACLDRVSTGILQKKMGFGVSQFRILYVLANKPEMTQKVIADFWDVTEASISRQIGILVHQGLVVRKKIAGVKNSSGVALTTKGKKALELGMRHASMAFENIFKEITDLERAKTAKLLEKFLGKIKRHAEIK